MFFSVFKCGATNCGLHLMNSVIIILSINVIIRSSSTQCDKSLSLAESLHWQLVCNAAILLMAMVPLVRRIPSLLQLCSFFKEHFLKKQ